MILSDMSPHEDLEARLRFETLLADISARFVHVATDQVDAEIRLAQQRIVEALDLDRSALWQRPEREPDTLRLTSLYEAGRPVVERANWELLASTQWLGDTVPALLGMDARAFFPWVCVRLLRGERLVISRLSDLPPEAARDVQIFQKSGAKSTVLVPLLSGGTVIGALSFVMVREERAWPDFLVERFALIARVFADALTRSRADQALRVSETRLNVAATSAGARLWELDMRTGQLWIMQAARARYQLTPEEEWTFERFLALVHAEDRGRVRESVDSLQPGQDLHLEYRVLRPDGGLEWEGTWGHLHPGIAGDSDRLLGASIDITEHKRKDEALEAQLGEIKALKQQLERENVSLRDEVRVLSPHVGLVGKSAAMRQVIAQAAQVAPTGSTVVILGETGTGKELIARAIHGQSRRKDRPLITVNCASLPPALIEAELFGREKGAYTGAVSAMAGRFELADGGTLFLDEIGELPLEVQAKLLRVLEDGHFERLGSPRSIAVDVRIIAATNRDLHREVQAGRFRSDLYFRLNVFPITIPPLRDRPEDIPDLVWTFVRHFEKQMGKSVKTIPKRSLQALENHLWPGNARELRNVIEHAMIISAGSTLEINTAYLPASADPKVPRGENLGALEREHILKVLEKTGWRITGKGGAAELLGLKRTTLHARMKKLGIHRPTR
ncbi:MAG TPA: sigma 54-interacting transcriptional regulator [Candidatus Baltobacteraceae bacterium]|nr:sigma 54-interacting transcriptional regulator [Candidatus Baltobacteraceae bacterium]